MRKILLAMDALHFRVNALDFAAYIAKLTKSEVSGIFLKSSIPETVNIEGTAIDVFPDDTQEMVQKNIQKYKESCTCREINASVYLDEGVPAEEILIESRYADLLIVDAHLSFDNKSTDIPSNFLKYVLAEAECPVIIAPESFDSIETVVFTYEDSKSCLFAIKFFTYLFPQFSKKEVVLLKVHPKYDWDLDEKYKITNWLKSYYSNITFAYVSGNAKNELFRYLFDKSNALVVMGAYGRNSLSYLFQPSKADLLIRGVNLPIFITHF